MRGSLSSAFVLSVVLPAALLAQTAPAGIAAAVPSTPGALRRAPVVDVGLLAAARLAADEVAAALQQPDRPAPADWRRVSRIRPGAELLVTTGSLNRAPRRFVGADDRQIVVLDLTAPGVQPGADRALLNLVTRRPDLVRLDPVTFEGVRIAPDGVFFRGTKIGERDEIFQRFARSDVVELASVPREAGSGAAVGIGIAVGAVGGFFLGAGLALSGYEGLGYTTMLALPIAGGMLGNTATRQVRQEIYYRRP